MSASGHLNPRRPLRLSPEAAVEQEREAVVLHLRGQALSIRNMVGRRVSVDHVMGEDEAETLARRIDAMADGIDAGLHLSEQGDI